MTKRTLAAALLAVIIARPSAAQDDPRTVAEVLAFLVTNQAVQTGSVERDRAAAQATSDTISRALLANLATLPVTSSSGAFAYRLNPELGTVERSTESFGPFFVERALTAGRSAAALGITFQHARFNSLDGRSLRDGSLITTANQFVDENEPFDIDQLALDIDADIATLYGNLGLGDRMEIGFAAPMVSLRVRGSRVNTYRGRTFTQATATATAIGLADLVVRTKYTAWMNRGAAVAGAVEARLPTGREEDLLGTGSLSVRFSGLASVERSRTSAYANVGVVTGGLARELTYGGALAAAATPRLTFSAELLGRWVDAAGTIEPIAAAHPTLAGVQTIRLVPGAGKLQAIIVAPGFKWNLTDTWVLAANVSLPLTHDGLTAPATPFIGFDYSIQR